MMVVTLRFLIASPLEATKRRPFQQLELGPSIIFDHACPYMFYLDPLKTAWYDLHLNL